MAFASLPISRGTSRGPYRHRRNVRNPQLRLRRGHHPRRLPAPRRRVRRSSASHSLRAQGQLDASHRSTASRARQRRRRQLARRGRGGHALRVSARRDRVHRRRKERRRDRPRGHAGAAGDQRRITRGARSHQRPRVGPMAPSRASRCESTPTSTRRAIRTSRPGSNRTSSAFPSPKRRRCFERSPPVRASVPIGVHVHIGSQITSLDPLERAAEAVVTLAADASRRGHRH